MLVNGHWTSDWTPVQAKDAEGRFIRQTSSFRNWITPDGSAGPTGEAGFPAEAGRYRLYVALICPWASRTLIARKLKRLEEVISVTVVAPMLSDQGWSFGGYPGADDDPLFGAQYMHEIYTRADPAFTGRATVPVLWDEKRDMMVNNESADILRMLNTAFEAIVPGKVDLYPQALRGAIDALNPVIYDRLNNGVYKAGFASSQQAYDEAVEGVFETLDMLEDRIEGDFLFGEAVTETDIRLFVTLIRFDAAYHGLFKTNRARIADYPKLQALMENVLHLPGVAGTVNMDHITRGYYSIKALNPTGITPTGPANVLKLLAV
ncbi:glutathione S-transferase family protein [Pseudooceanicola sediminis]|uniref:Glutathione S-transferase family protein n=1 Tax=Pseudooceanicola sediminis TaxID=2211117 RepID=A0A399J065_9RHOB|nr:glutathione S-transferase family protein [Pseudooceanicola sediminis]KAA2315187.1 glutathione S-transferase family protein [Puniceibacterium sp. HSS470]RII38828.1 glutathione S-transferase family protein [Pseudooceanicola sediminis]|tara:strand:+ start:6432 stop:7391 length:960 start_codon:yes stop_codon:yes gene_type:complete